MDELSIRVIRENPDVICLQEVLPKNTYEEIEVVSCSIGDAVGINRHFKEKNTDSHFSIYLGGTRSAQAQQISVSMYVAETVQHSDSSQVNGL